jgi:hypothetical protein
VAAALVVLGANTTQVMIFSGYMRTALDKDLSCGWAGIVAVYNSRNDAEQAYRAVLGSGIPQDHVRLSEQQAAPTTDSDGGSIWDWLFGSDVPETDQRIYKERVAGGGTVLSVLVDSPPIANLDRRFT